ncbi:MAG: ankyrin repeat domain-containing protein [Candidatus Poribacteria bacterium]|nr:ankyrin repeat domain-containing protein [Candidatus Poribacteria bacterium]
MRLALTGKRSDHLKIGVAAAGRGDLETVREIARVKPEWIRRIGSHGRTMLWEAAWRGKLPVVQFLAQAGADINAHGCHYTPHRIEISPVCAALHARRTETAEWMLKNGAVYDLYAAAYLGDLPALSRMLDENPSQIREGCPQIEEIAQPDGSWASSPAPAPWATPLMYAVCGQQLEAVRLLIGRGADAVQHSKELMGDVREHTEIARALIEAGANPHDAPTPISDKDGVGKLLAEYGVQPDPNLPAHWGWPPIVYYSRGDKGENPQRILELIAAGADVNARNRKGKTALHAAAKAGFSKTMAALIAHGADLNARDEKGETPLFDAARSTIRKTEKKIAAVETLLGAGADASAVNKKGETPLTIAQRSRLEGSDKIARLLKDAL